MSRLLLIVGALALFSAYVAFTKTPQLVSHNPFDVIDSSFESAAYEKKITIPDEIIALHLNAMSAGREAYFVESRGWYVAWKIQSYSLLTIAAVLMGVGIWLEARKRTPIQPPEPTPGSDT